MSSPVARFYVFESIFLIFMRSWVHGSNGHSSFSNLKILVYWVTPVLIDLHRFILSLVDSHHLYILNQRPNAPNPFAAALEAPGDGDFNNTRSIAWCCHWCIYYDIDYMADNSILSHAQYPHNVPTALLTIQYAYARLLSSCCMVTPRVCGHASRIATHDDFLGFPPWFRCIVLYLSKFSIENQPHVILLCCSVVPPYSLLIFPQAQYIIW